MDPWYAGPAYPPYGSDYVEPPPEEQKAFLQEQIGVIEEELNYLQKRLAELEQDKVEEKK
jgi:hypothetical protein